MVTNRILGPIKGELGNITIKEVLASLLLDNDPKKPL